MDRRTEEKVKHTNAFTKRLGIQHPIICGAMYPCSNPELVAAASECGGIGIIQPISLTYVYGYDFRQGLKKIRELTRKPVGMNVLVEKSSKTYEDRMRKYLDIALEEGIKFYITALGNPTWVVQKVHAAGGIVFHDVTERKWAQKAIEYGVDGLICVNRFAGGHAGRKTPEEMFRELSDLGKPLVCAGGIGSRAEYDRVLNLGYEAVQMGTRFIASTECRAGEEYKKAIIEAEADDIVLTERLTGVPVAVINTPKVQATGTKAGPIARWLLKHPKGKHYVRMYYGIKTLMHFKRTMLKPMGYSDYYQAGRSVAGIDSVKPVAEIFRDLTA